jgi:tetratricopeptide (TPR) repeat protein
MASRTRAVRTTSIVATLCSLAVASAGCSKHEPTTDELLTRADEALAADQLQTAEKGYRDALTRIPNDPVALGKLGVLYYDQGQFPQAYPLLKQASELQSDNVQVQLDLGNIFTLFGQSAQARDASHRILQQEPGHEGALLLLVRSAVTADEVAEARKFIESLRQQDSDRPAYHVALGGLDLRENNPASAEREFKAALDLDSASGAAYNGLGLLYLNRKDVPAAGQAFQRAAELSPPRSAARLGYLDFLIRTGATDAAKTVLRETTAKDPDYLPPRVAAMKLACAEHRDNDCDARVQNILAQDSLNYEALVLDSTRNIGKGDAAKAIGELEYLSNSYPRNPLVRYQLAGAYLTLAKSASRAVARDAFEGAERRLAEAVKLDPQFEAAVLLFAQLKLRAGDAAAAINPLRELLKQGPRPAQAYHLLASSYLVQNQQDEALGIYGSMMQLFPKDPQPPLLIGAILLTQNKPAEARTAFEKSVEIDPNYLVATERLVNLDISDKKYAAAVERVQKHIDKDPKAALPWALRAKIYFAQQDFKRAESDLLKAIELDPKMEPAYLMLGQLYVASNRADEAIERLKGFVEQHKEVAALMQLGILYEQVKNYAAARDAYEQLLTVAADFPPALNNLAVIYSERFGDIDKAFDLAKKANEAAPNDLNIADTLAWLMFKKGDYAGALRLLSDKSDQLSSRPVYEFHLGMIHYMLGEEEAARLNLQKAVNANADFAGKDEARARLAILTGDIAAPGARSEIEKVLRAQPNDPAALVRLAALQQRDGKDDQAIETYEKVIADNPAFAPAIRGLAVLYAQQRTIDLAKAYELATKARGTYPNDPEVAKALGIVSYRRELYPRSMELLREAAAKRKDDAEVLYYIGAVQRQLKQWRDCKQTLDRAWALNIPARLTGEARQALADCSDPTSRGSP